MSPLPNDTMLNALTQSVFVCSCGSLIALVAWCRLSQRYVLNPFDSIVPNADADAWYKYIFKFYN